MRLAIEGFFNERTQVARKDLIRLPTSERPAPDLILLRMTRDIPDLLERTWDHCPLYSQAALAPPDGPPG